MLVFLIEYLQQVPCRTWSPSVSCCNDSCCFIL